MSLAVIERRCLMRARMQEGFQRRLTENPRQPHELSPWHVGTTEAILLDLRRQRILGPTRL
jgi:hypothetical protein